MVEGKMAASLVAWSIVAMHFDLRYSLWRNDIAPRPQPTASAEKEKSVHGCTSTVLTLEQIHREFDPFDIAANVSGSLIALALCNWYHKRMIERKRAARGYNAVAGDDELDVELGEGVGGQETGVVRSTVDEELDRWDENEEDWETTDPDPVIGNGVNAATVVAVPEDLDDGKKRSD
jgi:hypothetical protein